MLQVTNEQLDTLRRSLGSEMSEKRYRHTLGVENMTIVLANLYCPELTDTLRVAALLHDLTKEKTTAEHAEILTSHGICVTALDYASPKTLHARSAAALISDVYPQFADKTVVSAVRWHTTGHENMTLAEQLIYLADYMDETRTFPDCVALREHFFSASPETLDADGRNALLRETMILSFDMTIRGLLEEGNPISPDTAIARNDFLLK